MIKSSGNMETVYQTEAQWTADERVFASDVVAITTDGPNEGKHKLFKGTGRWTTLSYVEDATSGTVLSVDAVQYDELATLSGTTDSNGDLVIDFTALVDYPGIASVSFVAASQTEATSIVGIPYQYTLSDYRIAFVAVSDGSNTGSGLPVQATFMLKYS